MLSLSICCQIMGKTIIFHCLAWGKTEKNMEECLETDKLCIYETLNELFNIQRCVVIRYLDIQAINKMLQTHFSQYILA